MKTFTFDCPVCGHRNRDLLMEETNGWMECENCRQLSKMMGFARERTLPVYDMAHMPRELPDNAVSVWG